MSAHADLDGSPVAVTTSTDRTVRIWNLAGASQVARLDHATPLRGALCVGPAAEIITGIG